jgi:SAM-dependent methyltransferase
MPFEKNSFDVVFADRVIQHLEPVKALESLLSVVKPGGRLVIGDPNWGTFLVDALDEKGHEFAQAWHDEDLVFVKNPYIGRRLPHLLDGLGLADVEFQVVPCVMRNLEEAFVPLKEACERLIKNQRVKADVAEHYVQQAHQMSKRGLFYGLLNMFVVTGVKK